MDSSAFVEGQRWISSTEPELGLGLITQAQGRVVQVLFPAVEEERAYARGNAPLSRVQFRPGESISDIEQRRLKVMDTLENRGVIIYLCEDEAGKDVLLPEDRVSGVIRLNSPRDRLFAGQIDRLSRYRLRHSARHHAGELAQSPVQGLLGPRLDVLAHQVYIARQVAERHAPRVLLADEVGLGKTIEAGMIVHQQLLAGRAKRVLIVVPESLLHQWLVEMLRRFNLRFSLLDEQRFQDLSAPAQEWEDDAEPEAVDNPFETAQLVLCAEEFLCRHPERAEQARQAGWDLLVVDEAHHLGWTPDEVSAQYACIENLARDIPGLLLLTATPEQQGQAGHFARLRLLDPHRYHDLQTFKNEEQSYQQISDVVDVLRESDSAQRLSSDADLRQRLTEFLGQQLLDEHIAKLQDDEHMAQSQLINDLLDRHGTGRVLFRNTRSSVEGFPGRQLHVHELVGPQAPANLDVASALYPDLWMPDWPTGDPRLEWLRDFALARRGEKALLICHRADTAMMLDACLRGQGVLAGVFHEGMSLLERDRMAAWFADEEDGAQLLLCSEIGSEGRNFQFAHHLILFDLPLNPDVLEQRIGRLDRIGQRDTVQIHAPVFANSPQQRLLRWFDEALSAFDHPFSLGQAVMLRFEEELHAALMAESDQSTDELIARTREFVSTEKARQEAGRDRLLELNSCHPDHADELAGLVREYERPGVLGPFMEQVFDEFGVEHESHSADAIIVRPGAHMQGHHFPELPEDGMTATFRRELALSREDMAFLSWEHPMVTGALDMILHGEFGNTALCTVKLGGVAPGTVLLEALYVLDTQAPRELQLGRYLPAAPIRLLRDNLGRDLSEQLSAEQLHMLAERVPKQTAHALVKRARPVLQTVLEQIEKRAEQAQQGLLEEALAKLAQERDAGLTRLRALAQVNPNVREAEILHYEEQTALMQAHLQTAVLRLDALRVAIAT